MANSYGSSSDARARVSFTCHDRRAPSASASGGAELREDVGHLEAGAHRLGALLEAVVRLLGLLEREHAEGDRHAGLERGELEARRGLAGDEVEVRRVAADHAAERDDAGVAARLRERHRRERQLERPRHRHDRDRVARDPGLLELRERAVEQPGRDGAVEAADDDPDRAARPLRLALEDAVAVRHGELALGVLVTRTRLLRPPAPPPRRRHRRPARRPRRLLDASSSALVVGSLVVSRLGELRALGPALAHASAPSKGSGSKRRSWWCRAWPSFSRLASR